MNDDREQHATPHGFFHTMVVMGSALALGCGGSSRYTLDLPDGAGGSNTGGGAGTGGSAGAPLGGSASTVFGGAPGMAGAPAAIGGAAAALDCPPAQWTCPSLTLCDADPSSATDCTCDTTRPKTAADCAADASFTCLLGLTYDATTQHENQVPYSCGCASHPVDCTGACVAVVPTVTTWCSQTPTSGATEPLLCECAPVLLR